MHDTILFHQENRWRSQQNENADATQQLALAHPPKVNDWTSNTSNAIGSPGLTTPQLTTASPRVSDQDDRNRARTLRIILENVNRHGRSSASLPDGTVLVGSSRHPFLDAARVLIAAGYDPASWVEGWRPGASTFALRARLEIAAGLTVDESRTVFAAWKPFSPSAVSSSIPHSEQAAPAPSAAPAGPVRPAIKKPPETELLEGPPKA